MLSNNNFPLPKGVSPASARKLDNGDRGGVAESNRIIQAFSEEKGNGHLRKILFYGNGEHKCGKLTFN